HGPASPGQPRATLRRAPRPPRHAQECRMTEEQRRTASFGRLEDGLRSASEWYWWGPYVSERQWGTVREDYSPDGNAWEYLPFDAARSTAYRWGEDGLAGFCDVEQHFCLGLALWNGRDPILKERLFGLNQSQANHGEDVKEYWWYLDSVPSHVWNVWQYHYPQSAFPYQELIDVNSARGLEDPEYELLDTGVFDDDRYWCVVVRYAKADPTDVLWEIEVPKEGPEPETTTSCQRRGSATPGPGSTTRPPRSSRSTAPARCASSIPGSARCGSPPATGRTPQPRSSSCATTSQTRAAPTPTTRRLGTRRTPSTTTSCTAPRASIRTALARRGRSGTCSTLSRTRRCACACASSRMTRPS